MGVKWHGDEYMRLVRKATGEGVKAATLKLHSISRKKASVSNAGQTVKVKRQTKGGNKTSRTVYPNSSKPGESPRRRTGFGQKNIVFGYSGVLMQGRVGYTRAARYMTYHELGIRYRSGKQQRPTIIPALVDNRRLLQQIISTTSRRKFGR